MPHSYNSHSIFSRTAFVSFSTSLSAALIQGQCLIEEIRYILFTVYCSMLGKLLQRILPFAILKHKWNCVYILYVCGTSNEKTTVLPHSFQFYCQIIITSTLTCLRSNSLEISFLLYTWNNSLVKEKRSINYTRYVLTWHKIFVALKWCFFGVSCLYYLNSVTTFQEPLVSCMYNSLVSEVKW